jgi:hypothetical protein
MTLPTLITGKRFTLPRPVGSADAVLLAQLALRDKAQGRLTAIVTADASDAQRLIEEIQFFRARTAHGHLPRLGNPALRYVLAAPGLDQ